MSDFWNVRYSVEEYIYGIEVNQFLKNELIKLPVGKILLPAEGEGRNAVFAAKHGWDVTAFDSSQEGFNKAMKLAKISHVSFDYIITDFESAEFPFNYFDCIGLFFAHQDSINRKKYHKKLLDCLKPGGKIILEAFSKKQLGKTSGGPQDLDLLFSKSELEDDFKTLSELKIEEVDKELNEGSHHKGNAFVINLIGTK